MFRPGRTAARRERPCSPASSDRSAPARGLPAGHGADAGLPGPGGGAGDGRGVEGGDDPRRDGRMSPSSPDDPRTMPHLKHCSVSGCRGMMWFSPRQREAAGLHTLEWPWRSTWVCEANPAHIEVATPAEEKACRTLARARSPDAAAVIAHAEKGLPRRVTTQVGRSGFSGGRRRGPRSAVRSTSLRAGTDRCDCAR